MPPTDKSYPHLPPVIYDVKRGGFYDTKDGHRMTDAELAEYRRNNPPQQLAPSAERATDPVLQEIEDALWALHSYESNRDDAGRSYSEAEITKMVSAIRALAPNSSDLPQEEWDGKATPRTDAARVERIVGDGDADDPCRFEKVDIVSAAFARELERELERCKIMLSATQSALSRHHDPRRAVDSEFADLVSRELARLCKVSPSTFRRWLSGESAPHPLGRDSVIAAISATSAQLPDIEQVSACVHAAWIASKLAQDVTSRKAEDGEQLMVPYSELSEKAKELDRATVRTVYAAIHAAAEGRDA